MIKVFFSNEIFLILSKLKFIAYKFNFEMKQFGDSGGLLLYNDPKTNSGSVEVVPTRLGNFCENLDEPEELRNPVSDLESYGSNRSKDKKEEKRRKEIQKAEESRLKKKQKYKLIAPFNTQYVPFIACNGPCTLEVNIGIEPFHARHQEFHKGLNT